MDKVVTINRKSMAERKNTVNPKESSDTFAFAQNGELILEATVFFVGILSYIVLLQMSFGVYIWLASLIALAGVAIGGMIWGRAMYHKEPKQPLSCVGTMTAPQAPPSDDTLLKEAA
jgi:hypothetical protein